MAEVSRPGPDADFQLLTEAIVGPLLADLGFTLAFSDSDVDEGGRTGYLVGYWSSDCQIQIYDSSRAGSVNCMIAPPSAPPVFGPHDRSGVWKYLAWNSPEPELTVEEAVEAVTFTPKTTAEQLGWVRDQIRDLYESARTRILDSHSGDEDPSRFEAPYEGRRMT